MVGSLPAYGRGFLRSFDKVEVWMGDQEFTLFVEYLKRYNHVKRDGETEFMLRGLTDAVTHGSCKQRFVRPYIWMQTRGMTEKTVLLDTTYRYVM